MLAYILLGLILGGLAWQLKHEPGDPRPASQFIFGVVGSVAGGVVVNLAKGLDMMAMPALGFAVAAAVAVVVLVVLQVAVSRKDVS